MRTEPRGTYSGITIVLDRPSRFDKDRLLSGRAGQLVADFLQPECSIFQCDIRTLDSAKQLLPNTKGVLLLGERSLELANKVNLNNWRGAELRYGEAIAIASWAPQDCLDIVQYEPADEADDDTEIVEEEKDRSRTARSNYRFWLAKDINKLKRLLRSSERIREPEDFRIFPPQQYLLDLLRTKRGERLWLDIETDGYHLSCFSFAFGDGPVHCVPLYRYDGKLAYLNTEAILAALGIAQCRNEVACHNIGYDLPFLALYYGLPFGRNLLDTMLVQHRIYPEAEKSLSHCISLWTDMENQKNMPHTFQPRNKIEERQLWEYNCRDVHSMRLIFREQMHYASRQPGLPESIAQANSSLYAHLLCSLVGIAIDSDMCWKIGDETKKYREQYHRIVSILAGYPLLPSSSKQMGEYLYQRCGYRAPTYTPGGKPAAGRKQLLKLAVRHDNPVIPFALRYREEMKRASMTAFTRLMGVPL